MNQYKELEHMKTRDSNESYSRTNSGQRERYSQPGQSPLRPKKSAFSKTQYNKGPSHSKRKNSRHKGSAKKDEVEQDSLGGDSATWDQKGQYQDELRNLKQTVMGIVEENRKNNSKIERLLELVLAKENYSREQPSAGLEKRGQVDAASRCENWERDRVNWSKAFKKKRKERGAKEAKRSGEKERKSAGSRANVFGSSRRKLRINEFEILNEKNGNEKKKQTVEDKKSQKEKKRLIYKLRKSRERGSDEDLLLTNKNLFFTLQPETTKSPEGKRGGMQLSKFKSDSVTRLFSISDSERGPPGRSKATLISSNNDIDLMESISEERKTLRKENEMPSPSSKMDNYHSNRPAEDRHAQWGFSPTHESSPHTSGEVAALKRENARLKSQIEDLSRDLGQTRAEQQNGRSMIGRLELSVAKLEKQLVALGGVKDSFALYKEESGRRLAELQERNSTLEEENARLKEVNSAFRDLSRQRGSRRLDTSSGFEDFRIKLRHNLSGDLFNEGFFSQEKIGRRQSNWFGVGDSFKRTCTSLFKNQTESQYPERSSFKDEAKEEAREPSKSKNSDTVNIYRHTSKLTRDSFFKLYAEDKKGIRGEREPTGGLSIDAKTRGEDGTFGRGEAEREAPSRKQKKYCVSLGSKPDLKQILLRKSPDKQSKTKRCQMQAEAQNRRRKRRIQVAFDRSKVLLKSNVTKKGNRARKQQLRTKKTNKRSSQRELRRREEHRKVQTQASFFEKNKSPNITKIIIKNNPITPIRNNVSYNNFYSHVSKSKNASAKILGKNKFFRTRPPKHERMSHKKQPFRRQKPQKVSIQRCDRQLRGMHLLVEPAKLGKLAGKAASRLQKSSLSSNSVSLNYSESNSELHQLKQSNLVMRRQGKGKRKETYPRPSQGMKRESMQRGGLVPKRAVIRHTRTKRKTKRPAEGPLDSIVSNDDILLSFSNVNMQMPREKWKFRN